jgi:hypothetical protein
LAYSDANTSLTVVAAIGIVLVPTSADNAVLTSAALSNLSISHSAQVAEDQIAQVVSSDWNAEIGARSR